MQQYILKLKVWLIQLQDYFYLNTDTLKNSKSHLKLITKL